MAGGQARAVAVGLCIVALAAAGCGDLETLGGGCDIRSGGCQGLVFQATAKARGQSGAPRPEVRTIDVAQLEAEYMGYVAMALEGEEDLLRAWDAALSLLGLLSPATSTAQAVVDEAVGSVGAFYDPTTGGVTVVDRGGAGDPEGDLFTLAHEFAHALQDETGHLGDFQEDTVDSTDSLMATTSLIEGEATVLGAAVLEAAAPPGAFLDWDALGGALRSNVGEAIEQADEPLVAALNQLPYTFGYDVLEPLFRFDGPQEVLAIYDAPALKLRSWAGSTLGDDADYAPLECFPTTAPNGYEAVDHDRLGMLGPLALSVIAGGGASRARSLALHWRDDRMVVFRARGDDTAFAVAWRLAASRPLDDTGWIDDFAAVAPGILTTTVADDEVVAYAATETGVAASWDGVADCGAFEDLPERDDGGESMMMALRRAVGR